MAKFIGGPYDGMDLDHQDINRCAFLMPKNCGTQLRLFALMPPVEEWERIRKGEIEKNEVSGTRHPYERVFTPNGPEFHDASKGAFDQAMRGEPDPDFVQAMEDLPP